MARIHRKELMSLGGFLLFMGGTLSIVLSLIGADFSFMMFLNTLGPGWAIFVKILMIATGLVLTYFGVKRD